MSDQNSYLPVFGFKAALNPSPEKKEEIKLNDN